eukprot:6188637-Pleurochrysis_carterae.AAC.3
MRAIKTFKGRPEHGKRLWPGARTLWLNDRIEVKIVCMLAPALRRFLIFGNGAHRRAVCSRVSQRNCELAQGVRRAEPSDDE